MNADINETTKAGYIGYNPFKLHAFFKITNAIDVISKLSRFEFGTRVMGRFGQLLFDGSDTDIFIIGRFNTING